MKTTFIQKVWSDDTGGGTKVDFVLLSNGVTLTITDELIQSFDGEPWEKPTGKIYLTNAYNPIHKGTKQFYREKDGFVYCRCGLKAIEIRKNEFVCSGITVKNGCTYKPLATHPVSDPHEVSLVAAIISDFYCKQLYEVCNQGYIYTIDKIVELAEQFYAEHEKTDWQSHLDEKNECWDDCVIRWAGVKLSVEYGQSFSLQS